MSRSDISEPQPGKGGQFRVPPRTWVTWTIIFAGIILLILFKQRMESPGEILSQYQFEQIVDAGQLVRATILYDQQNPMLNEIEGRYYKGAGDKKVEVPFRATVRLNGQLEEKLLSLPQTEVRQPNHMLGGLIASVVPFVLIALCIWFFFIRRIRRIARNAPDMQAKSEEQQARFDRLLDKWEVQARRIDGVLERIDKKGKAPDA